MTWYWARLDPPVKRNIKIKVNSLTGLKEGFLTAPPDANSVIDQVDHCTVYCSVPDSRRWIPLHTFPVCIKAIELYNHLCERQRAGQLKSGCKIYYETLDYREYDPVRTVWKQNGKIMLSAWKLLVK